MFMYVAAFKETWNFNPLMLKKSPKISKKNFQIQDFVFQ